MSKVVTIAWYKQHMRRRSAVSLSLLLASIVAGTATAAQSASSAKPTLISTVGAVESLAMDGRRVAYDLEARSSCNTLHVWDTVSKQDVVVSGAGTCGADSTSTGAGVREIAVAGRRVSWIVNLGGNTESADTLYAATVGGAKEKKLASALRTGDVDGVLNGTWIGNLAGDGDLTALNRWKTDGGSVIGCERRQAEGGPHDCARGNRLATSDVGRLGPDCGARSSGSRQDLRRELDRSSRASSRTARRRSSPCARTSQLSLSRAPSRCGTREQGRW